MDPFPEITKQITETESFLLQLIDKGSMADQELARNQALESLEVFQSHMKELKRRFESKTLECRFDNCDGRAVMVRGRAIEEFYVCCQKCRRISGIKKTRQEAIDDWES